MNFRSVADLNRCVLSNLHKLPRDIDLIVGIPRSGLLPATILALYLNLPETDIEGLLAGRLIGKETARWQRGQLERALKPRRILVIDDSLWSGKTMDKARRQIEAMHLSAQVIYAAVYVIPGAEEKVDLVFETCPLPRIFEWNFMHHFELENACIDIDGVLCRDPTPDENDDGPRYSEFLNNCEPFLIPTVMVGCLVTCRLEKYRPQTVGWLKKQGVRYKELVMLDLPDKESRLAAMCHSAFKAEVYQQKKANLFVESSFAQAVEIVNKARKPVLCVEKGKMIQPSSLQSIWHYLKAALKKT